MIKASNVTRAMAFGFLALSLAMTFCAIHTSLKSNLWEVLPTLNQQPWFIATIIDFYFNIAIISVWTLYRERCVFKAWLWIVGFICLGSIATAFYVFLQLIALKPGEPVMNALIRKDAPVC